MNKKELLKKQLIAIRDNNWVISNEIDPYELSLEMLDNIGSTDPILRDDLILNMLLKIIEEKQISYEQMKEILNICLSENHLFCGIGKHEDDTVFNRTFSSLIIEGIILSNNSAETYFLSEAELLNAYKKVIKYFNEEKDLRGYVENKGWAHSSAHTADTLCSFADSEFLKYNELKEILAIIKKKICIDTYTYINQEDERLVTTFMHVYNRHIINDEEIINWIYSFDDAEKCKKYTLSAAHLRENRKIFLRSLYFRAMKCNLDKHIINAVDEVLNHLTPFY